MALTNSRRRGNDHTDGDRGRDTRIVALVAWVALVTAVAGLAAVAWTPGSTFTLGLAALSPELNAAAIVSGVLFAIVRGRWGWCGLAASVVVLIVAVALRAPLFLAEQVPPGGHDLVVMTVNLRLGGADAAEVVANVRRRGVDVLMLEELTDPERRALARAGLDTLLPHSVVDARSHGAGTGLWSTYRVSDPTVRRDFGCSLVEARVAVPGAPVAPVVVALHMYGPYPSSHSAQWLADIGHLPSVLAAPPPATPVIAGGDFNATQDVAQYRDLLVDGYADATDQAGAGLVPTYPADRFTGPLIAIDHVVSRGAVARSFDSVRISGTDHRAVVVRLRLP